MRAMLATTMMLLMMTAALAGCAGGDSGLTQEESTLREKKEGLRVLQKRPQ